MMNLEPQHARRYFEARLKGRRLIQRGDEVTTNCIFHDDHNPSLSVNFQRGVWTCHAGCGNGGILEFEEKVSHCDHDTARANVAQLIGEPVFRGKGEQPEATYPYPDAQGKLVFEKLRYPGKRFAPFRHHVDRLHPYNG